MNGSKILVGGIVALLLSACGGASSEGQGVMSPEERLAEQERLAYEAEQNKKRRGDSPDVALADDEDKTGEFDKKQSKMELQRATRSAKSCSGVVDEEKHRGEAKVTITFSSDGSVRDASITPPFDGTKLGECILNAYKAVIVPPFDGSDKIVDWDLTVEDPEPEKK
jgi:hypothetical protein